MIKDGIIDRGAALNAAYRVLIMMSHLDEIAAKAERILRSAFCIPCP